MDKIFINNLCIDTFIGIYPYELAAKQTIILDIELQIDASKTALKDNIDHTVDYDLVVADIIKISQVKQFKLLETFAEYICQHVLEGFATNWIKIKITKPRAMPETKDVGIIIERSK